MKYLSWSCLMLLFGISAYGQIDADTALANQYLKRMAQVTDDESKEDSIYHYAEKALQIYSSSNHLADFVDRLLIQGRRVYESYYLDAALKVFDLGIREVNRDLPDRQDLIADLYFQKSRGRVIFGLYSEAKPDLDSCLLYRTLSGDKHSPSMGNTYNLAGVVANNLNKYTRAEIYHKKALEVYTKLDDPYLMSRSQSNLATVYGNIGLQDKAVAYYQQALKIREELLGPEHAATANILVNLGGACNDKGAYVQAIDYLRTALPVQMERFGKEHLNVGKLLYNLGVAYRNTGQYTLAEDFLIQSQQIFSQLERRQFDQEILIYQTLANVKAEQGETEAAIRLRKKGINLLQQSNEQASLEIGEAYDVLGLDFLDVGRFDSCFFYFQKAEHIFKNLEGAEVQTANLHNNMALAYMVKGDILSAKDYTRKALSVQKKILEKNDPALAYSYNSLAIISLKEGQAGEALKWAQQAIVANHESFSDTEDWQKNPLEGYRRADYLFESILLKAKALEQLGQMVDASHQYRDADELLESTKNQLISRQDRLNQSKNVYRLSKAAIQNSLQLAQQESGRRYLEMAFYYAEKSKASVLAQSITANNAKYFAGLPAELIRQEEQLQSDINYYSLQLANTAEVDRSSLFRKALFEARQNYQALIQNFEQNYPFYYELRYSKIIPQAKAVQFALEEDQAVISYFTADTVLYSFLITKDKLEVSESGIGEDFQDQITGMYKGITLQLDEDYIENAQQLYTLLMPFQLDDKIGHLIFVPDGRLVSLPLEALLSESLDPHRDKDLSHLPYLLKDYRISYAPSVSIFHQQKSTVSELDQTQVNRIMALAPVFEDQVLANETSRAYLEPIDDKQRSFMLNGQSVSSLPATKDEILSIQEVFLANDIPAMSYLTSSATEAQIKREEVAKSKYLHIATHGFVNESHPDLSGLMFYPDPSSQEDGILAAAEVYSLRLSADLVSLSACETGIGKLTTGEGILGLSRAFLYAGAKNLMVSLWKVADRSTAQLMGSFYREHLNNREKNYAYALRQAKLNMISSENFNAPYYWSAFVLIGE